jgi:hypothetical protein
MSLNQRIQKILKPAGKAIMAEVEKEAQTWLNLSENLTVTHISIAIIHEYDDQDYSYRVRQHSIRYLLDSGPEDEDDQWEHMEAFIDYLDLDCDLMAIILGIGQYSSHVLRFERKID